MAGHNYTCYLNATYLSFFVFLYKTIMDKGAHSNNQETDILIKTDLLDITRSFG